MTRPRRLRPIPQEAQATVNDAMVPGAFRGRLPIVAPVTPRQRMEARARGITAVSDPSGRSSQIDYFTCAGGAEDFTLTYMPVPNSWNVFKNGQNLDESESECAVVGQTLSILSASGPVAGDKVRIQYDYLTGTPSTPNVVIVGSYDDQVLADNPIAYWKLNDAGTAVADFTGNGHDGTMTGTGYARQQASLMPTDTDTSTEFQYMGGSGNAHFTVPDHSAFDTSALTLEFWTNRGASGGAYYYEHPGRVQLLLASGDALLKVWSGGSWVTLAQVGNSGYTNAISFRHYAITYDGSNVRFYHDGNLYATVAASTSLPNGTGTLKVGPSTGPGTVEDDRIQKFAVYGTALSAARIAAHYGAG